MSRATVRHETKGERWSDQRVKFVHLAAKLGNNTEAYRRAYPKSRAWGHHQATSAAARLMAVGYVREAVERLRHESEKRLSLSRDGWLARVERETHGGERCDRLRALEILGKALGYLVPDVRLVKVERSLIIEIGRASCRERV